MTNKINPKMLMTKEECCNKYFNGNLPEDDMIALGLEKGEILVPNGREEIHSKHYFDTDRNIRGEQELIKGVTDLFKGTKNSHEIVRSNIPSYYIGKRYKIEARKVIEDFELSYNIGTAVTYLLRAEKKHDSPIECITKAIAHLEFELDKIKG